MGKGFNNLCHLNFDIWWKMHINFYVSKNKFHIQGQTNPLVSMSITFHPDLMWKLTCRTMGSNVTSYLRLTSRNSSLPDFGQSGGISSTRSKNRKLLQINSLVPSNDSPDISSTTTSVQQGLNKLFLWCHFCVSMTHPAFPLVTLLCIAGSGWGSYCTSPAQQPSASTGQSGTTSATNPDNGETLQYMIWHHITWSILVQVMACCLTAPSHYPNQCWLLISVVLWHSPESNFTVST